MTIRPSAIKPLPRWSRYVLLGIWITLCLFAIVTVANFNITDARREFTEQSEDYVDQLNKDMISSETILKGFSALFGAVGKTEPEKVSRYVQSVIKDNHQIFALEISQKVARDRVKKFTATQRRAGIKQFSIKSFSYDANRKWFVPPDKPFYYPIVFMEPLPPNSDEIFGLDMESIPFLRDALMRSIALNIPVPTHPFKLVQGNLAYVVFCPIPMQEDMIVDMVIDAAKLERPDYHIIHSGFRSIIYHKDFKPDDPQGQLLFISNKDRNAIETAIFPLFIYQKSLSSAEAPFSVLMTRQIGWSDLSLGLLELMGILMIASSWLLLVYHESIKKGRLAQIENQNLLWKLANQDALTGIPNRMLLLDRLEQSLAVSERNGQFGAIIFLDLDHFKELNDDKGHDVGDILLVEVAKRIKDCVRDVDTVARLGGDEFIIVLNELGISIAESEDAAKVVADKVHNAIQEPYQLKDFDYRASVSIGVTMFRGNQTSINELLKSADKAMYEVKKSTRAE